MQCQWVETPNQLGKLGFSTEQSVTGGTRGNWGLFFSLGGPGRVVCLLVGWGPGLNVTAIKGRYAGIKIAM